VRRGEAERVGEQLNGSASRDTLAALQHADVADAVTRLPGELLLREVSQAPVAFEERREAQGVARAHGVRLLQLSRSGLAVQYGRGGLLPILAPQGGGQEGKWQTGGTSASPCEACNPHSKVDMM